MYCGLWGYLHFTQKDVSVDGLPTSRVLGIWFIPETTRFQIRLGTNVDWNEGLEQTPSLTLNKATVVKIETSGKDVRVSYDGTVVASVTLIGTRISGAVNLYCSGLPGWTPPNALFGKYVLL
jgi:hypothetical protein